MYFFINNLNPIMLSAFLKLPEGEISEELRLHVRIINLKIMYIFYAVLFAVFMILLIKDNGKKQDIREECEAA